MKKASNVTPNQRLKAERERRGWSQKYVAEQIGADHYYLSRWEHGTVAPSPYYRRKLCLLFGKDASELGLLREEASEESEAAGEQEASPPGSIWPVYDPAIPLPYVGGYRLVGREKLLRQLKQQLFERGQIALSALNGLPGVGKTSLALSLTHDDEVKTHFCDGILWVGVGPEPNILSLLSRWGTLLGIASAEIAKLSDSDAWIRAIHAAIGNRKLLIVIDDAWKLEDALAFKVGGAQCAYIMTTRFPQLAIQFAARGATVVQELNEEDSIALLARMIPDFVEHEPDEARTLVRAVGGLPLALILIGKYLHGQKYSGQLRRLRAALNKLQQAETRLHLAEPQALVERFPSLPLNTPVSLHNLIAISDQQLDEQAWHAFRALSLFPPRPNSFSEEAALAVCAVPVETLDTLSDAGLLEGRGEERYSLHQVIADFARTNMTGTAAYERMAKYFAEFVEARRKDYNALDQETVNIFAALQIAFEHHRYADLVRTVNAFTSFLDARGLYAQAEEFLARAREAATLLDDRAAQAETLLHSGDIMVRQGNYAQAQAYLQDGLTLAREIGHREHLTGLLQSLGMLAQRQGNYAQAEAYLQEGLALARQLEDRPRICMLLKNLGTLEAIQGNYVQAEAYLQEGLTLTEQIGDHETMSLLLLNSGQLASERGNVTQAEMRFQEALRLAQQIGHREAISLLLTNLGVLAGEQKNYVQAEKYLQEGLSLARQMGYRERIGLLLTNLGWIASEQGNYAEAEACLQEGAALASQVGNQWLICGTLKFLGDLQLMQKQYDAAEATFRTVLEKAAAGNQRMKGEALFGLAEIALAHTNYAEARAQGQASLAIFESIGQGTAARVRQWLDELPGS